MLPSLFRFFCAGGIVAMFSFCLPAQGDEPPPPLHARIDALLEGVAVGPLAPPASDADFLRRVYLDLTGMIPTSEEARAFLADTSPDKRTQLVDRLLASPQFARQMAVSFDNLLMERRSDKAIKTPPWQAFLKQSFAENKPLDQLCRELIVADGADEALRPAARFLLDRDCEPNLVTRDVGRMMFGMDLQCAQCHDHPAIDDYLQSDYYGLFAFFLRTSAFNDPQKKLLLVAEKAEGEANFKSVFTNDSADRVAPRIPHGALAPAEPSFAKGEEYLVAPAKNVRPVPKHSRRAQLAAMLADSPQFRLNWANRLWAHLFGRGIVHPVDFHHPANPPRHPEVLSLLAEELARCQFDAKTIMRQLALTRAYQRTCEAPAAEAVTASPAAATLAELDGRRSALRSQADALRAEATQAQASYRVAQEQFDHLQQALAPLQAQVKATQDQSASAVAAMKQLDDAFALYQQQARVVADAAAKVSEAAATLPDDPALAQAKTLLVERAAAQDSQLTSAAQALTAAKSQAESAAAQAAAAQAALAQAQGALPSTDALAAQQKTAAELERQVATQRDLLTSLEAQIQQAQTLADFAKQSSEGAEAASQTWEVLVDRLSVSGQLAPLRSLTSEQFALSLMQATGVIAQRRQAAVAAIEKAPPEALQQAPQTVRPLLLETLVEEQVFEQLRSQLGAFGNLYGTQPGADFQATVNQALFFENGSLLHTWLAQSGGNLTDRLAKIEDPNVLAEELYLSILTRFPTAAERDELTLHLGDRQDDRPLAVGELVWALVASNEFRFNH